MSTNARSNSTQLSEQPAKNSSSNVLQRRVLLGGSVGQFIEFYDFTLYGLSAVVFTALFFPEGNPVAGLLVIFATFGVAFFMRPLGGIFFGALGDKYGRRRILAITLFLIGGSTALIGCLPTFGQIGWLAPVLLVLCRLIQGFSAGGESVGAPSFVFEHSPRDRRGLWINITLAATGFPAVVAGAIILLLSTNLPDSAFMAWGWRLPFFLALPLSIVGLWIRSRTQESEMFKESVKEHQGATREFSPLRATLRENKGKMFQVLVVIAPMAMGFYFVSGYFVTYIQTAGNLGRDQALLTNALAIAIYVCLLCWAGSIGDRIGRKPMLLLGGSLLAVVAVPSFALVTSGNMLFALLGQLLFVVCLAVYGGGCFVFFVEIFPTRTRFTSAALSYNTSYAVFGGTAPFLGTFLVDITGLRYSPGIYMAATALVVVATIIVARIPETRGMS